MKEVRIGVIGCGPRSVGLIRQSLNIEGFKITAVCDKIEPLVQKAAAVLNDPQVRLFTDHQKMLKEAAIDAVFVIVAPEDNVELVCQSLEAGKHVMCEVPLAYTIEECWRVVLAVEKSSLKFQMAEQTRHWPFITAWKNMVARGELGKILFVEGQYLHGRTEYRYYHDRDTGEQLSLQQAKNNPRAVKSRSWNMHHPILYLPHELSPILSVLDDRVAKVTCMGTRPQSYHYDWFPSPDFEMASMHTANDTVLRLAAAFTVPTARVASTGCHWYHVMGSKGRVETNRSDNDKMKMWLADGIMRDPAEVDWHYNEYNAPPAALRSGHSGADYYPMATFVESILKDKEMPMDVYKAAESAAPAICAVKSVENGSIPVDVPDFRPGAKRKKGAGPEDIR